MKSFVTVLSTDGYLDGVLAMVVSLRRTNTTYPILCLVTPGISLTTVQILQEHGIPVHEVPLICSPFSSTSYKNVNYTKLNVYGLEVYEKLVYIDADMVVLQNIDELFEKPHMAACRAGKNINWKHFKFRLDGY